MNGLWEIVLALLAAAGALAAGWALFGALVTPLPEHCVYTVILARGDGEELERVVRGLRCLRSGREENPVFLLDDGLTPRGFAVAEALMREEGDLILCPPEQFPALLREEQERETR